MYLLVTLAALKLPQLERIDNLSTMLVDDKSNHYESAESGGTKELVKPSQTEVMNKVLTSK